MQRRSRRFVCILVDTQKLKYGWLLLGRISKSMNGQRFQNTNAANDDKWLKRLSVHVGSRVEEYIWRLIAMAIEC